MRHSDGSPSREAEVPWVLVFPKRWQRWRLRRRGLVYCQLACRVPVVSVRVIRRLVAGKTMMTCPALI